MPLSVQRADLFRFSSTGCFRESRVLASWIFSFWKSNWYWNEKKKKKKKLFFFILQIPCFWRSDTVCWINASRLYQTKLISQLSLKSGAKPCWLRLYQQRLAVFRMWDSGRVFATAEMRISNLTIRIERFQALADGILWYTRWRGEASNESNRIISGICICGVLSVAGYHFGLQAFNTLNAKWNSGTIDAMAKDEKLPLVYWVANQWTQIIAATNLVNHSNGLLDPYPFFMEQLQGSDNSSVGTVSIRQKWFNNLELCEQEKCLKACWKPEHSTGWAICVLQRRQVSFIFPFFASEGDRKSFIKSNGDFGWKASPYSILYSPDFVNAQENLSLR